MRSELDVLADKVAYAMGKVIARKTLDQTHNFRRLDGLGQVTAVHELANRMAPELEAEALAAVSCVLAHKHLFMADQDPSETTEATDGQAA
jgi:hypothetical protein